MQHLHSSCANAGLFYCEFYCMFYFTCDRSFRGTCDVALVLIKKVKVKKRIAVSGIPSHSYGTSLAIWDNTVFPATRHK